MAQGGQFSVARDTLPESYVSLSQLAAQTTAEIGPRVEPREAPQEACQVASADVLPIALQPNFQVAVEFGSPIADRDAVEFAVGFAAQVTFRLTV